MPFLGFVGEDLLRTECGWGDLWSIWWSFVHHHCLPLSWWKKWLGQGNGIKEVWVLLLTLQQIYGVILKTLHCLCGTVCKIRIMIFNAFMKCFEHLGWKMHSIFNITSGSVREKGLISSKCLYLCIFANLNKKNQSIK